MEINDSNTSENNQGEVQHYKVPNVEKKRMKPWQKGLIIFAIIFVVIVLLAWGCASTEGSDDGSYDFDEAYIGEIFVEGTISEDSSEGLFSDSSYNHDFLLERIENMIEDDNNKGIILFVNTPGGSVYASDELYLKLEEYKEKTGRPVYSYMGSMAASGGYYISAGADKIIANRNCWTGSIGVTIGTVYDLSGLLENLGVSTVTITSGENKAMGSSTEPLTEEQREIYQSLVDEAYEQFVDIVATGRNMSVSDVKKIADGRVYTAKQAKANGLVDDIMTFDEAVSDMKKTYNLEDCEVEELTPEEDTSLLSILGEYLGDGAKASNAASAKSNSGNSGNNAAGNSGLDAANQYDQIKILLGENNKFTVTYMANISK